MYQHGGEPESCKFLRRCFGVQCGVGIEQDAGGESTDCQWRNGRLEVSALS